MPVKAAKGRWLPLGQACELLAVNQSTLRQWANSGRVRIFRTAGGHRRFLRDDLTALMQQHDAPQAAVPSLEENALRRIRRKLHSEHAPQEQAWMTHLSPEGRLRLRLFGRRLLDLSIAYMTQRRRRAALVEEARAIGEEYGVDLGRAAMPLGQVMEAFCFFRTSLFDAVRDATRNGPLRGSDMAHLWGQMDYLADQILLAMVRAYERSAHAPAASVR
ncbi:MAG: helix-turn-helix domain-containing protein [Dehalococcoidia bacterium]|nr:helix-turn-helix domain-containing protein [Dehalococcoidia bacterium]